jgi:hypothetical protein
MEVVMGDDESFEFRALSASAAMGFRADKGPVNGGGGSIPVENSMGMTSFP